MFAKIRSEINKETMIEMTNDKVEDVQLEIEESKNQVHAIIIDVIERGEKISNLEEKSNELVDTADLFNKKAKKIKRRMCCQEHKMKLLIFFIILCIIALIGTLIYYKYH